MRARFSPAVNAQWLPGRWGLAGSGQVRVHVYGKWGLGGSQQVRVVIRAGGAWCVRAGACAVAGKARPTWGAGGGA